MKLHIACGEKRLPGFTHVDIRPEVNPDIVADASNMSMIPSHSVEEVYFCHGIEHLSLEDARQALREFRRVLRLGGVLRIATGDFTVLSWMYTIDHVPLRTIRAAIMGGQDYLANTHYSVWDFEVMKEELEHAGFTDVSRYNAEQWLPDGYWDWSIGEIAGECISLNVISKSL